MRNNKATIAERLSKIELQEQDIKRLEKFMATNKGKMFASLIDRRPIKTLIRELQAPKIRSCSNSKGIRNLCYYTAQKTDSLPQIKPGIRDYTRIVNGKVEKGEFKLPRNLTFNELKQMNSRVGNYSIKRDNSGHPIMKTINGYNIYDAVANIPILKYTSLKNRHIGVAAKCHAYEEHKMKKWDKKNPTPTLDQVKMDLFPNELLEALNAEHRTKRYLFLQNVRDMLAKKYDKEYYWNPIKHNSYLRMYAVTKRKNSIGETIIFEQECDPYIYGYPFTSYNTWPSLPDLNEKLRIALTKAPMEVFEMKVYDMYGNLKGRLKR